MGIWTKLFGRRTKSNADRDPRVGARKPDGDSDQVIADLTEAIRLDPRSGHAYFHRARTYAGRGDYEHALADFTEAIRLNPQIGAAYHDRAVIYTTQLGDHVQAIADLTSAARLEPTLPPVYFNRGLAHAKLGNYLKAIEDFTQALDLDPKYAAPLAGRAGAFMRVGDDAHALDDLGKLLRLLVAGDFMGPCPVRSPADVLLNRARLFIKIADFNRAIAECNNALPYGHDRWVAYALLGLACASGGNVAGALRGYRQAGKHEPPDWYINKLRVLERATAGPSEQQPTSQELIAFGTWVDQYGSIGYGNTLEVTQIFRAEPVSAVQTKDRADLIARILLTPAEFIPVVLYRLAAALFADGKTEDAIFWLNAARLRTWYDSCRCADIVARNASLRDLEVQVPDALRHAEREVPAMHARIIQAVLDWDEKTPYLYDHRWIYQHGAGAYVAEMGPEQAEAAGLQDSRDPVANPGALCLPENRWPELRQRARAQFRAGLEERIQRPVDVRPAEGTACGPQLRQDVLEMIGRLHGRADANRAQLVSAQIAEVSRDATSFGVGLLKGSWSERWDVALSGTSAVYEIRFKADGQGGTHFTVDLPGGRGEIPYSARE